MFRNFQEQQVYPAGHAASQASTIFLAKVFNWMAIGLALTAVVAFVVASSPAAQQMIFGNKMVFYGMILYIIILTIQMYGELQQGVSKNFFLKVFLIFGR